MDDVEYVSIGPDCFVAQHLRKYKLRRYAYPLDWAVSSPWSVYGLLKNNFEGFMDELVVNNKVKKRWFDEDDDSIPPKIIVGEKKTYPVMCKKYSVLFPHFFDSVDEETIEKVRKKMELRIKRFLDLLSSDKKVFLVYTLPTLASWQKKCFMDQNINLDIFTEDRALEHINMIRDFTGENINVISLWEMLKLVEK